MGSLSPRSAQRRPGSREVPAARRVRTRALGVPTGPGAPGGCHGDAGSAAPRRANKAARPLRARAPPPRAPPSLAAAAAAGAAPGPRLRRRLRGPGKASAPRPGGGRAPGWGSACRGRRAPGRPAAGPRGRAEPPTPRGLPSPGASLAEAGDRRAEAGECGAAGLETWRLQRPWRLPGAKRGPSSCVPDGPRAGSWAAALGALGGWAFAAAVGGTCLGVCPSLPHVWRWSKVLEKKTRKHVPMDLLPCS